MRKTKLRQRSKSKATIDKANRALQDWFRANYQGTPCESCGNPFQVMHHHIEKSKSNAGKFNHDNLVFLCNSCHSGIHYGNHNIVAVYSIKRGNKWLEKMKKLKLESRSPYSKKELEEIIERYKVEPL